jgi:2-oxoisovalerate dehydrogenase E1 component
MAIDLRQLSNNAPNSGEAKSKSSLQELLSRDISLTGNRFGDRQKERFYSELQTLLTAGVDIRTALELLENEAEKKDERELFAKIRNAVISGSTLPDAVKATGRVVILHEDTLSSGFGAELSAWIVENCFEYLDAPVMRCASLDTAIPMSKVLEDSFLAKSKLAETIKKLLAY